MFIYIGEKIFPLVTYPVYVILLLNFVDCIKHELDTFEFSREQELVKKTKILLSLQIWLLLKGALCDMVFSTNPSWGKILGRNRDKSLQSFPSCYSQTTSTDGFYSPPPHMKSGLKLVQSIFFLTIHFNLLVPIAHRGLCLKLLHAIKPPPLSASLHCDTWAQ